MKILLPALLIALAASLTNAQNSTAARQAAPLDTQAATEALRGAPVRPRLVPKSASPRVVVKREYVLKAKGAGVEIVEFSDKTKEEHPYVAVPILFVQGKTDLLDEVSRRNVTETIKVLQEVLKAQPEAVFLVQGHASVEGDNAENLKLSIDRAARIQEMLLVAAAAPKEKLSSEGLGEAHASVKNEKADDAELQQDRRVLVVRLR